MEKKYFLKIEFIEKDNKPIINLTAIGIDESEDFDNLEFFHKHVAHTIDITTFFVEEGLEHDYALVVDDEGLLVSGNAVFKLVYDNKYERELSGTILVGRNKVDGGGVDTIGMTKEEVEEFLSKTEISVIGFVR